VVEFGSLQHETTSWHQGQPHDLYGFDELPEFTESQFRFVIGWNRTRARASAAAWSAPATRRPTATASG
jgi:hypothetical protein